MTLGARTWSQETFVETAKLQDGADVEDVVTAAISMPPRAGAMFPFGKDTVALQTPPAWDRFEPKQSC